jgi:hypothetical protein
MQAAVVYGATGMELGALSCIPGLAIVLGQCVGGAIAPRLGNVKMQCVAVLTIGGSFVGGKYYSSLVPVLSLIYM